MKWTFEQIAVLGTMTDKEVSLLLKKPKPTITAKRLSLGIKPFYTQHSQYHTWTADEIALLGTMTDKQLGKKLGITGQGVTNARKARNIPAFKYKAKHQRILKFDDIKEMDNRSFYEKLNELAKGKLSYKILSELCYVSHSRVQKWFSNKPEPLSMQLKHHFYLAVLHEFSKQATHTTPDFQQDGKTLGQNNENRI